MRIRLRRAETECRQAAGRATGIANSDLAQDARRAADPVPVSWVHAQLRDRIQQAGAALALDTQAAHRQMRETDTASRQGARAVTTTESNITTDMTPVEAANLLTKLEE